MLKGRIAYGGTSDEPDTTGINMRATARSILSSYGSGTPGGRAAGTYSSRKVKIMVALIRDLEKTLWNYLTLRNQKRERLRQIL